MWMEVQNSSFNNKYFTWGIWRYAGDHTRSFVFLDGEHGQGIDLRERRQRSLERDTHDVLPDQLQHDVDVTVFRGETLKWKFNKLLLFQN